MVMPQQWGDLDITFIIKIALFNIRIPRWCKNYVFDFEVDY
jgi:hypothetical protein